MVIGDDAVTGPVKVVGHFAASETYAASIGFVRRDHEASEYVERLTFARIDGVRYGSPSSILPSLAPEPSAYWPLEVGNTWVFSYGGGTEFAWHTVRGTEIISDTTYAVVESCQRPAPATPCWETRVRVDNRTGIVYWRTMQRKGELFCGLLPTAQPGVITCAGTPWLLQIDAPATVMIGTVEVPTPSLRWMIYPSDTSERFAAGIGPLPSQRLGDYGTVAYARINGIEYGVNPVAGEAAPTALDFALAVSPNPTSGAATLTLALPAPARVVVEAFDALGRRVMVTETDASAGETQLGVDARGWAPGVYLVRATTDGGASVTARIVRR